MATATKSKTTFGVCCPHCHDADATLSIDLADAGTIACSDGCDETFSAAKARDMVASELARWEKVVRWAEAATAILAE